MKSAIHTLPSLPKRVDKLLRVLLTFVSRVVSTAFGLLDGFLGVLDNEDCPEAQSSLVLLPSIGLIDH